MSPPFPKSARTRGRLAGLLYLGVAATGFFSYAGRKKVIALGDAANTAESIRQHSELFAWTMVSDVLMTALWLGTALVLFDLLRHAGPGLARSMLALVAVGCATVCANDLFHMGGAMVVEGDVTLAAFSEPQRDELALLLFGISRKGLAISNAFFGLWLLPLGYLVWVSGRFPSRVGVVLAVLLAVAGFGYLADSMSALLADCSLDMVQMTFFGEVFLLLWLLVKGAQPRVTGEAA